ncbi:hypothetical protein GCM10022255_085590 [Dactylosporangium darangshiense]|uniref:Pyrrolo-quinoline quinone repeat domain-containing protein n=1 Tax=Dactylosporangium darangshiense TaxID=579108 RepID=A0ABP8DMP5_9ACTN
MDNAWIVATPDGYVLADGHEVFSLGNDGRQRWHQSYGDGDVVRVDAAGSTVIVSWKNPRREEWPGSLIVKAFDTTSGTALWSDDQPSFVSVHATAVYTSVCHGGQNNRIGDCHLSARDPRTGHTRWTIATYASSIVLGPANPLDMGSIAAPPVPPYLVIESFPTGYASKTFTTVDPSSGRNLGTSIKAMAATQTSHFLIEWDDDRNRPETGCTSTLVVWGPHGGNATWRKTFTNAVLADGKCRNIDYEVADDALALADNSGATTLLDLATGTTDWTAGEPGPPMLITNDVLVISNADGGVTTYDRKTGSPQWRTMGPAHRDALVADLSTRVLDKWLVVYDRGAGAYCSSACPTVSVLNLDSGSLYRAPQGRLITTADGIVITETKSVRRPNGTADYHAYAIH